MKILLTAINAKYIHSNLALYTLHSYASEYKEHVEIMEFTMNQYIDDILQQIYKKNPDIIAFSCYIWNIKIIEELVCELHKILPQTKIWLGGPEVSYDAQDSICKLKCIDGIMVGEGEETFLELLRYYIDQKGLLKEIKGIVLKEMDSVLTTPLREPMDLNTIPFPYKDMEKFKNRIIYYESSRGCPYSCSYCLSSIDKSVRFRDVSLVKEELQYFLDYKVPQVKFVDRTFNCNKEHAVEIWTFLKEQDNGVTNFHFEISADILGEPELNLLSQLRPGLVQLEIGVQSTHQPTIQAIRRKMDLSKLRYAVEKINSGNNIHQHLDLIAGLPYENYETFQKSFNEVYSLKPEQLQLGFLKVLKGSAMYEESKKHTIVYKNKPPYEVLYTEWLNYYDVCRLKAVEEMVEVYFNSGQFTNTMKYLENFHKTPFDMYESLSDYYDREQLSGVGKSRIKRYEILLEYFKKMIGQEDKDLKEILLYDLYLRENLKSRPDFAEDNSIYKERYRTFYLSGGYSEGKTKQMGSLTHIEHFHIDIIKTVKDGVTHKKEHFILFDYQKRNPLNYEAETYEVMSSR